MHPPADAILATMRFEIEVYREDGGQWIATAVEHDVTAKGLTEKEALARVMEALAAHFKKQRAGR
jgi:predicted RNase H-like HicB family nuclease